MTDINEITLSYGGHRRREDGMCAMEAVAWLAGEAHSDQPECVCRVIAAAVRNINDLLPDDAARDRVLRPYLERLIGTRSTPEIEKKRAFAGADYAVRVIAAEALDRVDVPEGAKKLRGLDPITDKATALSAAHAVAHAAHADYYADYDAANAVAYAVNATNAAANAVAYAVNAANAAANAAAYAAAYANAANAAACAAATNAAAAVTAANEDHYTGLLDAMLSVESAIEQE